MEWGQQFMAALESLEMLGAFCWFLHLIKSNFLFSKDFYFLVWKMSGWGGCLGWRFETERTSCFKAEDPGTDRIGSRPGHRE